MPRWWGNVGRLQSGSRPSTRSLWRTSSPRRRTPEHRAAVQRRSAVRQRTNEQGFTLVELLIAIALVGILSAVAIVGLSGLAKSGNNSSSSTVLGSAKSAATTYYANTGLYPTSFSVLVSGASG